MASFQGSADIWSANLYAPAIVQGPGEKPSPAVQDESSCIRTIRSLFPVSGACRDGEPPAKRRKVGDSNAVPAPAAVEFNDRESVVLVKISLDLVCT